MICREKEVHCKAKSTALIRASLLFKIPGIYTHHAHITLLIKAVILRKKLHCTHGVSDIQNVTESAREGINTSDASIRLVHAETPKLSVKCPLHRARAAGILGLEQPAAGAPLPERPVRPPPALGDLAAASPGRAGGRAAALPSTDTAPLVGGAGGQREGAAVHHPGIEAIGHGEGLEVAAQGHRERKLVHQVHGRAGHHGSAAQVLQAQHLGEKRSPTKCLLSRTRPTTGHRATSAQPPSPPRRRAQALATAHLPHRAGHGSAHPAAFVSNSVCPRPETPPPSLPPALREDGPRGPLRTRDHRLGAVTKILQMCAKDGPPLSCSADVDGKRR